MSPTHHSSLCTFPQPTVFHYSPDACEKCFLWVAILRWCENRFQNISKKIAQEELRMRKHEHALNRAYRHMHISKYLTLSSKIPAESFWKSSERSDFPRDCTPKVIWETRSVQTASHKHSDSFRGLLVHKKDLGLRVHRKDIWETYPTRIASQRFQNFFLRAIGVPKRSSVSSSSSSLPTCRSLFSSSSSVELDSCTYADLCEDLDVSRHDHLGTTIMLIITILNVLLIILVIIIIIQINDTELLFLLS